MSETVKLIIELPKEDIELICKTSFVEDERTMFKQSPSDRQGTMMLFRLMDSVKNGTPLSEELAENKGEWIKDGSVYRCSNCNHYPMGNIASEKFENLSRLDAFYFCPHCGADMRKPKDILHEAIDNTTFAEEAYPNIKEELHKTVDMAEPIGEKPNAND